jgi:hypothetical protein
LTQINQPKRKRSSRTPLKNKIQREQKVKSSRRYTVTPIYDRDPQERRLLDVLLKFLHVDQLKNIPARENKS